MRRKFILLATAAVLMTVAGARAAEVEVRMLNKGVEGAMVFEPALVKVALGDTVKFVATDKAHKAIPQLARPSDGGFVRQARGIEDSR
jgi:plastocyanin